MVRSFDRPLAHSPALMSSRQRRSVSPSSGERSPGTHVAVICRSAPASGVRFAPPGRGSQVVLSSPHIRFLTGSRISRDVMSSRQRRTRKLPRTSVGFFLRGPQSDSKLTQSVSPFLRADPVPSAPLRLLPLRCLSAAGASSIARAGERERPGAGCTTVPRRSSPRETDRVRVPATGSRESSSAVTTS